jgi:CHAT domain-containing protein/tetratricopeptide (TPR) repeat protein
MRRSGFFALLLTFGSVVACQADVEPQDLITEGYRLLRAGQTAKAQRTFETAVKEGQDQKNPKVQAEAHRGLGQVFTGRAEYPAARREFETALTLFDSIPDRLGAARTHTNLAIVTGLLGELPRSRELFDKAIAELDALQALFDKAEALFNFTLIGLAPPDQRSAMLSQALDIARRVGNKRLEGQILHAQGDIAFGDGDFDGAVEKLEAASALLEQVDADTFLARVLVSLGRIYRIHGQADRALPLYARAFKIQEKIDDKQGIVQTLNAMGVAYDHLGKSDAAVEAYQKALSLALETGSPRLINFQRGALASAFNVAGKYAEAIELLEQVLSQPIEPWLAAYRYSNIGEAYYGCGQFVQAVTAFDRAADFSRRTDNFDAILGILPSDARAKAKLGWDAEALADARETMDVIDRLRAKLVPSDFMKRGFNEQFQSAFAFAIELQHKRGDIESALLDAERARGRAFLDLLATRNVQVNASKQEKLTELRGLEKELQRQGVDPSRIAEVKTAQPTMRGHSDAVPLLARWQRSELQLRSLVSAEPMSIKQMSIIARRLNSTILIYWVSEERTFIWVIKPDGGLHSRSVDVLAERLAELVRDSWGGMGAAPGRGAPSSEFTLSLRSGDSLVLEAGDKKAWQELYRHLIKPVSEFLPRKKGSLLTIVPHGPLFRLSFAGLLDGSNRYLVEDYSVHYVPAVSILQFLGAGHPAVARDQQTYLLISNPRFSPAAGETALADLPGSEREVQSIARILPAKAVKILNGAEASEESVRSSVSKTGVLHFATHGIVRDDQVLDSFLALAGHDAAKTNDGHLTAQEVYGLDLAADLVVLSACRSGRGKVTGDGVAGLTRAFFYAGASSVLATLWDVADEPTSLLLRDFYKSLNARLDKSRALRNAQLSLLRRIRAGEVMVDTPAGRAVLPEHPVFWASFVLQGQP